MKDLKPCPHCGDENIHTDCNEDGQYYCICSSCASQGGWAMTQGGAIRYWNMRFSRWHPWPDEKPENSAWYLFRNKYTKMIEYLHFDRLQHYIDDGDITKSDDNYDLWCKQPVFPEDE